MASLEQRLRKEHQTDLQAVPSWTFSESQGLLCFEQWDSAWNHNTSNDLILAMWYSHSSRGSLILLRALSGKAAIAAASLWPQFLQFLHVLQVFVSIFQLLFASFALGSDLPRCISPKDGEGAQMTGPQIFCRSTFVLDLLAECSFWITEGQCRAWARGPAMFSWVGWMDLLMDDVARSA